MTRIVDDDEAEIEAEIQRQLDEISAENLEIEDLEDTLSSFETNKKDDGLLPESIEEYLKYVQSRTETIQQEVRECDDFLIKNSSDNHSDEILANRIKEALGDDCHDNPLEIRNKVLSEIEEVEKQEEKERSRRASNSSNMTLDIIRPVISDEVRLLEETAEKQLQELEAKQSRKHQERILKYEKMKQEENKRLEREQNAREMRQRELEEAQNRLNETQKIQQEKLEKDMIQEQKELSHLEEIFQKEIKELEEEKEKEQKALEQTRLQEENNQRTKKHKAAIVIQKSYRGHRVFVQYREVLQEKKTERLRKHEEELEKKYQEEITRKEAERQSQELQKKMRIEEERLRKEEIWKKEMEEKKRREEEKKRKEEEERKRREEEERKRKEEEEMKRREEEKKRKEEERRRREEEEKQELERKKRENEEQKRREEEIRCQEEMKKEEDRMRQEELNKQKEQEKKYKEEKRIKELEKEEIRKKETERKQQEELQKIEEEKKAALEREEMKKIELKKKEQGKEKQKIEEYQHKKSNKPLKDELLVNRNAVTSSADLFNMEELRRKWLNGHTLWSIQTACEDREQPVAKSRTRHRPRRPFSASKSLPQLTKEQILQASPPGTPLHKVIRVLLSSCPACKLHGLDSCPNLKALDMKDCGLLAVEGLDECKELKELTLQDNKIEHISVKGLHQLEEMILRNNNLASVQGLTDCPQLKNLDLRNNRVTRIGDLSTCSNLQILNLNNNQLITTKGLSNLIKLQSFKCTNNHLPDVKEIDSCQLLQTLNLTGNNLQKPPSLTNHVLLRELILDDNSISTLEPLSDAWLPSLRVLSVCQNSISDVANLKGCIMLQSLDIRYNLISDLESLLPGLGGCRELSLLKIAGNPVNEEPQCRNAVIDALLVLTQLDDEVLQTKSSPLDGSSPFITMCNKQLHEYTDMKSKHEKQLSVIDNNTNDSSKVTTRLELKSQQFNELLEQAVAHLIQHEAFDSQKQTKNPSQVVLDASAVNDDQMSTVEGISSKTKTKTVKDDICKETRKMTDERIQTDAAIKIQSVWRGWHIRHLIDVQTKKWLAAVTIQAAWRGHFCRSRFKRSRQVSRARKALWNARHVAAATTIQAYYRGYRIRRILAVALQNVKSDSDDDDFNYDEEVDLSAFDFDTGVLDDGWTPSDTPQLPSRGPVLPGQSAIQSQPRRQAWRSADSPFDQDPPQASHSRVPGINVNRSPEQDLMSVTSGAQSHMTHQAEEMGNEWGVKNVSTAELMWKRANRMKYNPARKRKLLDPTKRLALFKKLDEANKLKEVRPPPKRRPRVDYFTAREALLKSGNTTPTSEREAKAQMTYSWVHSQGVVHQDEETNYMGFTQDFSTQTKPKIRSSSLTSKGSVSLPQLDPVQLTGRNIHLVSSPALIREQIMSKETTPRRNSSVSEARSVASGSTSRSNEKSNSAGARMTNERRERR